MLTPEQIADGWIEHDGGPCPVPLDSRPIIMTRDGLLSNAEIGWSAKMWTEVQDWWQHQGPSETDIIAYKPENNHD